MEKKITGYTTVDISQWHRKEHFEAFQSVAQCTYNQTVQLDITAFLKTVKKNKHKFYPAFIHILARLMNAHPEFALTYINCVAVVILFHYGESWNLLRADQRLIFAKSWPRASRYQQGHQDLFILRSDLPSQVFIRRKVRRVMLPTY